MIKKPGFQFKFGGETLLYTIILILLFSFIVFMPNIYKLISKVKTSVGIEENNKPITENDGQDDKIDNNQDTTVGKTTMLICTKEESITDVSSIETYTFFYQDDKLEQITNNKKYEVVTDNDLNYVNDKYALFENINNLYKDILGFRYNSTLEDRKLNVTFSYDLTVLNPENLYNENQDLSINLHVTYGQSLSEVKSIYESIQYNCR